METILNDLVRLSDRISNRVEEVLSSCNQQEFDRNGTINNLINESVDILIDMLKDNGIEFYVDIEDIKSDRYHISFIIFLFNFFNSVDIVSHIRNTPKYLDLLSTGLVNANDDEFIVTMLEILKNLTKSTYHIEAYNYLHDKIKNNDAYAQFIMNAIDIISSQADNTYVIFDDIDREFIDKLISERKWFSKCITDMIYKGAIPVDHNNMLIITNRFAINYSIPDNVKILSRYETLYESNKLIIDTLLNKIRKGSDLYEEYYSDSDLGKLPTCMIVTIIISKLVDYHLFKIQPNFERIIKFASSNMPVKSLIEMIPTRF